MALRDVVLRFTSHEMVGDETVELWLKIGAGAWALFSTGPVETDDPPFMDFELDGLTDGVEHVAQVRVQRSGRYRAGYLGTNPEDWPDQSRIEFVPGATAAPAPTIDSGVWARTSSSAQNITLTITPNAGALDLDLVVYRDGVEVGTIAGPHVGDRTFEDDDPDIAEDHVYTARHRQFTLDGTLSDPVTIWAGPLEPTDLTQIGDTHNWYGYEVQWTIVGAASTRVRDNWPLGVQTNRTLVSSPVDSFLIDGTLEKDSAESEGGDEEDTTTFVEVRHEKTSFTVTDVSKWVGITVTAVMAGDETIHP